MREAYRLLDGKARYPAVSLEQVELLVSLGGDMLGAATEAVGFTRAYADRRRRRSEADFRHVHIEGNLSLTGAASDERVQATASERFAIAAALLRRLSAGTDGGEGPHAALIKTIAAPQTHAERLDDLVKRLSELPGRALVISGSRDPAEQALVVLINRALGAEGNALRLDLASAAHQGSDSAMAQLLADMKAGKVGALFVLDHNPVEQLPGGEALAKQIAALPLSVTLSARPTATADACKVVAAAHHPLERWSDAVLSLAQPTIRPLFDTRDPMTSLLRWSGEKGSSYEQLRAEWKRAIDKPGGFEKLWDEALSSGTVPAEMATAIDDKGGTEPADVAPADAAALAKLLTARPAAAELEVELLEEVGRRDGSDGFNPWLVELPDPITRASWVATARLAPKLAKAKGIKNGDLVRISVGKTTAQMQARIVPGQHPKVIGLPVGYGMKDGVRVVRHGHRKKVDPSPKAVAEHNAYRLAALAPTGLRVAGLAATLERSGDKRSLPLMQWHSKTEGRPIVHQVLEPNGKIPAGHHGHHALWGDERKYSPSWHMTIDLDACTGCSACVIACQAENNIPVVGPDNMTDHRDMHWLRIDRYYMGSDDDPEVLFEPMLCAQCDNAPCETVCPVAATVHSHDGLNQQVYNRCVGTRYCANNCPYKVRRFNWFDFTPTDPLERLVLNPDVVVRDRGTMEKCTFCVQRIQGARIESKGDKRPLEVQTACQQSCPAKAIHFGDAHADPIVRKQTHEGRAFQVLDDLGVKPSVTYLARVRRRPQRPGDKT